MVEWETGEGFQGGKKRDYSSLPVPSEKTESYHQHIVETNFYVAQQEKLGYTEC